jgi:hypothetical protein
MERYKQFDQWLLNRINDAYLWLYDWTGIFVATVIFLNMNLVVLACIQRQSMWIGAIVFLCGVLISTPRYYLQSKGPEAYNKIVLASEGMSFHLRTFFLWFNTAFFISDLLKGASYLELVANVANAMLWFLMEIKIRDRDKKTFKQPKLAQQRSS